MIRKLHHRRSNGDPTLLFHLHPVRLSVLVGTTAFYCTGGLNGLSEQQHLLGDGSLTGVRVRNNGKSAALRHLLQIRRQRHNSFFLSKRHRAALVENEKLRLFYPSTGEAISVYTGAAPVRATMKRSVGAMPSGCSRWCAYSQQVASPALMPPRISDSAVSPTISTRERSGLPACSSA